jgi:hypothetical protein
MKTVHTLTLVAAFGLAGVLTLQQPAAAQTKSAKDGAQADKAKGQKSAETKPAEGKAKDKTVKPQVRRRKASDALKKKPDRRLSNKAKRAPKKLEMTENAKFVCDKPTQSHPPVWRGDEQLSWTFQLRNNGTEPLDIRAKGG